MSKGIFTISIDTEMAWGTYDHGGHIRFKKAYDQYRAIIHKLLYVFKKYDVSATWAVVGRLFLDGNEPHWYGRDIVKLIQDAFPKQEIASHSFSHINFLTSSKEEAKSDLKTCVALADKEGLHLESFVYPRNQIEHLDVLSQMGFKTYRYHPSKRRTFFQRSFGLLKDMLPITPPVVTVFKDAQTNLLAIPASFHFRYAYGWSRWIVPKVRFLKAKKGMEKAIQEKKLFHLWFHPIDFAWKTQKMFLEFEEIVKLASSFRKEGKLAIVPMKDISL